MGPTIHGPFRKVASRELEYRYSGFVWVIIWDTNKRINIGEWSICGGGQLERFFSVFRNDVRESTENISCLFFVGPLHKSGALHGHKRDLIFTHSI